MRPQVLFPLFADIASLQGIGPRFAKLIGRLAGTRLVDLIWHRPISLHDWSHEATIATAAEGTSVTLKVVIVEHKPGRDRKSVV